ncbi:MAG: enoyl-CoA hydratase/isomerase family protein, partial [Alphaproteobacteria bacterium]
MTASLTTRIEREVAVVRFANPPLNTLDAALRDALASALDELAGRPGLRAVVLAGQGRHFAAGPPLEPDEPPERPPTLAALCARVETFAVPVVVALRGMCLGPGLELALAAAGRVAAQDARLGCPEVTLGVTPRAGGSQRLVRLAGPAAALEMLLEGSPVTAARAAEIGLLDRVVEEEDPLPAALEQAHALASGALPRRQACAVRRGIADGARLLSEVALARRAVAGSRLLAPGRIVDCVEAAALLPWEAAVAFEAAAFEDCAASAESRALRHVMRAELAADIPGAEAARAARAVRALGFLDCSAAAAALAARALERGLLVTVATADGAAAGEARERIEAAARGRNLRGTLSFTPDPGVLAAADAIIEAGSGEARGRARAALVQRLPPTTPLLALFSDPDSIEFGPAAAGELSRRLVAAVPAPAGRLVELIAAERSGSECGAERGAQVEAVDRAADGAAVDAAEEALAAAEAVARALGLMPVVARGRAISATLRLAMERAAGWLVEKGATPAAVDGALRAAGFTRLPFAAMDSEGLEHAARRLARAAPGRPPLRLLGRLVELGRRGRASGQGFYGHDREGRLLP